MIIFSGGEKILCRVFGASFRSITGPLIIPALALFINARGEGSKVFGSFNCPSDFGVGGEAWATFFSMSSAVGIHSLYI